MRVPEPEPSEQDYLRQIELLARDVVDAAPGEASTKASKAGWGRRPPRR